MLKRMKPAGKRRPHGTEKNGKVTASDQVRSLDFVADQLQNGRSSAR